MVFGRDCRGDDFVKIMIDMVKIRADIPYGIVKGSRFYFLSRQGG